MYVTTNKTSPSGGEVGVEVTQKRRAKTTEARKVKFGMHVTNAMHVAHDQDILRNGYWRGEKGVATVILTQSRNYRS